VAESGAMVFAPPSCIPVLASSSSSASANRPTNSFVRHKTRRGDSDMSRRLAQCAGDEDDEALPLRLAGAGTVAQCHPRVKWCGSDSRHWRSEADLLRACFGGWGAGGGG